MTKKKIDNNIIDFVRFWLQSAIKAPIGKREMDALTDGGRLTSLVEAGRDYVIVVEVKLKLRSELEE